LALCASLSALPTIFASCEEAEVNVMNDYWCSKCNGMQKVLSDLSSNMVDCPQCGFLRQPSRYLASRSVPRSNFDYGIVIGAVILAFVIWSNISGSSMTSSPPVPANDLPASSSLGDPAAAVINDKLSRGITPSGQDIDRATADSEMRKALRAFYGTDD
jgi:DNA-directed RNA polymerase subunit RPC12/RpoP